MHALRSVCRQLGSTQNQIKEFVVREVKQTIEPLNLIIGQTGLTPIKKARQHQIVLEQPPT